MATESTLQIRGFRDESVPNRLLRPRDAKDHLAVLLPGFGYTLDMPLFYYAEDLLIEQGWDVLRVEFAYNTRPEFQALAAPERVRWLLTDTTAAYRAGMAQRDYGETALIGKSLGTLAMGHLLTMDQPAVPTRAVWLTPLIGQSQLRQQIAQFGGPSLFVIGTADPDYDAARLDEVRTATSGETVVVNGADHGLDVEGDPVASVRAVERVVEAMAGFLAPSRS